MYCLMVFEKNGSDLRVDSVIVFKDKKNAQQAHKMWRIYHNTNNGLETIVVDYNTALEKMRLSDENTHIIEY